VRILIVDDNMVSLLVLRSALEEAGYEVEAATNGREALNIVRQGNCRLVISDWEMPEMDGLALCNAIRAENLPGYVYIILLTGRDGEMNSVEGLSAGADDFITKPFSTPDLIARVRTAKRILSLETRDLAIFAMAKLAESRDTDTGAHLERVRNYSRLIANDLFEQGKFPDEVDTNYVKMIFLTSPLHDIGKVAIPDCVLLKPGRLSDREFEIMKTHTTMGAETLDAAIAQHPEAEFLMMAKEIAETHHERFDGTGYPQKLKGEQIPLSGRIVALADVYDALTSKRVYKGAYGHDVARSIVIEGSGTHFDPVIVESFLRNEARFIEIQKRYAESQVQAA
jgi:putative two-component system response regulator